MPRDELNCSIDMVGNTLLPMYIFLIKIQLPIKIIWDIWKYLGEIQMKILLY